MKDFFDASIQANQEIYKLLKSGLLEHFFQAQDVGAGGDVSTNIDLIAESIFVKYLQRFGKINSEESGLIGIDSKRQITIDPIDGSENFLSCFPYFGTSVALQEEGKTIAAVVVNLANGELFIKDEQNFLRANLENLTFKKVTCNAYATLGIFERSYCSKKFANLLKKQKIKYRSPGAFALSLAYAHDVDFVLYEGVMRIYDIAAGLYMCEDLYSVRTPDLLLVSKDKEIFDKIAKFIL